MSEYKTTHLAPSEIDRLRLQAFVTNSQDDMNAYYRAASLYFQERDVRAMNRANRIEELKAKLAKAVEALEFVEGKISWEINPSNYDHDEICHMNTDWCEIGSHVEATLAELKGEKDE